MIYTSAIYANPEHTQVTGTDADGNTETVPHDHILFRQPEHGPVGFLARGGVIADYEAPPTPSPLTLTLTKRQVNAALILAGHTDPDAFVESAIDTIADPTQKALALNDWRFAPYFQRSHPLLNDEGILAAASLTPEQVDGLWAVASTLPA